MAIDRIDWHWEEVTDAKDENEHWNRAGAHIGYYVEWAFKKGFANPDVYGDDPLEGVNGLQLLLDSDAKLGESDFNEEGQKFSTYAYSLYMDNYESIVGHGLYDTMYNNEDLNKISDYLDNLYVKFKENPIAVENKFKELNNNKKHPSKVAKNLKKYLLLFIIFWIIALIISIVTYK